MPGASELRDSDAARLAQLASLFGTDPHRLNPQSGDSRELRDEAGEIVSLGPAARQAGGIYAARTGRSHRHVDSLTEALPLRHPAVVVTTSERLDRDLFHRLYVDQRDDCVAGLVHGRTPLALRSRVLLQSAAAYFSAVAPPAPSRRDIYPTLDIEAIGHRDWVLYGGRSSAEGRIAALTDGVGVLTIQSHSDGIDAYLGPFGEHGQSQLSLCAFDADNVGDPSRRPRCRITGYCHRFHQDVHEAMSAGALVSTADIAGRIVVLDACRVALVPNRTVDPLWGMLDRLVGSPKIGALVASWAITAASPRIVSRLADDLERGLPVGNAVARHNRSQQVKCLGSEMALFGDPMVRLSPTERQPSGLPRIPDAPSIAPIRPRRQATASADWKLLRHLVGTGADRQNAAAGNSRSRTALRELALHRILDAGQLISKSWLPLANFERPAKWVACVCCGLPARCLVGSLFSGATVRELVSCAACGIVQDIPQNADLRLTGDAPTRLQFSGSLPPQANWSARLLCRSKKPSENRIWEWPADGSGAPARLFCPAGEMPVGPIEFSLYVLWDLQFAELTLPWTLSKS